MHYRNKREAVVGDPVIGTTYNRKGTQVGILVGITPGAASCNARVMLLDVREPGESSGMVGLIHSEALTSQDPEVSCLGSVTSLGCPVIDYTDCFSLWHADDALEISNNIYSPAP